jgi:hypothetical protein
MQQLEVVTAVATEVDVVVGMETSMDMIINIAMSIMAMSHMAMISAADTLLMVEEVVAIRGIAHSPSSTVVVINQPIKCAEKLVTLL